MRRMSLIAATMFALVGALLGPSSTAWAASASDAFYTYAGAKPLASIAPGTALKTRTVNYSIQGLSLPLKAIQILYRTTNALGGPSLGATTLIRPLNATGPITQVLSYQSFYDSLNPADEPSVAIAGGGGMGTFIANAETGIFAPLLLAGAAVNIPDTEGPNADFSAGPEYGRVTVDSLRAITQAPSAQVAATSKVVLFGYSGGAIASEWAAEMAPTYAPAVAKRIIGTAIGGILADPAHNLSYISGSTIWSGVMPMSLVGLSRAYHIDLSPYLSAYGKSLVAKMQNASITQALGAYPGLTWQQMALPAYANPNRIPAYVNTINRLIMGKDGTPTAPMFMGQGTGGYMEATFPSATYGAGDGVMVAGDVRTLARTYCSRGVTIKYQEYPLSHVGTMPAWMPAAYPWILDRFAGKPAPSSCGSIAPGNSIAPVHLVR